MSTYLSHNFTQHINPSDVEIIFELGSRDLKDSRQLHRAYNAKIYSFECNPDSLNECRRYFNEFSDAEKANIVLVEKAVALENGPIKFYPFDLSKYDNMGASSLLKIDFSLRTPDDPDYLLPNPQKEVVAEGIRLDSFCEISDIPAIDMLCIDLQGYELNALKSLGEKLKSVKYIITESSIQTTYLGGASFVDLDRYLVDYGFKYVCSDQYGIYYPNLAKKGYSEFNVMYIRK